MSKIEITPISSALVLFSGGQDSATCLAWALERFDRVETVGFDYGQRHAVEMQARQAVRREVIKALPQWADRLGDDHVVDLTGFGAIGETAMTTERAIEADARGLPNTFVPGRNLIFLVAAAALADRRGLEALIGSVALWRDAFELTIRGPVSDAYLAERVASLSPQQYKVLVLVAQGLLNKQIADRMGISLRTVKAHMTRIMDRLGVRSRTQAIRVLHEFGISEPTRSLGAADPPAQH